MRTYLKHFQIVKFQFFLNLNLNLHQNHPAMRLNLNQVVVLAG